jgi:hypothetical protein
MCTRGGILYSFCYFDEPWFYARRNLVLSGSIQDSSAFDTSILFFEKAIGMTMGGKGCFRCSMFTRGRTGGTLWNGVEHLEQLSTARRSATVLTLPIQK